jgi:hypothetical protein
VPHASISRQRCVYECVFRCSPGRANRRDDAAPLGRHLGIRSAGKPAAQLIPPIPREHRMRVRVDEAGHDGIRRCVDRSPMTGESRGKIPIGTGVHDSFAVRGERAIDDRSGIRLRAAAARHGSGARHEFADVPQDQHCINDCRPGL